MLHGMDSLSEYVSIRITVYFLATYGLREEGGKLVEFRCQQM
jgi:hypothetical protein